VRGEWPAVVPGRRALERQQVRGEWPAVVPGR
jgi:hypothetical protein